MAKNKYSQACAWIILKGYDPIKKTFSTTAIGMYIVLILSKWHDICGGHICTQYRSVYLQERTLYGMTYHIQHFSPCDIYIGQRGTTAIPLCI